MVEDDELHERVRKIVREIEDAQREKVPFAFGPIERALREQDEEIAQLRQELERLKLKESR